MCAQSGYEEVPAHSAGRSKTRAADSRKSFSRAWEGTGLATDPALETPEQKIRFDNLMEEEMGREAAGMAPDEEEQQPGDVHAAYATAHHARNRIRPRGRFSFDYHLTA